jgi:hypothetical protein
MSHRRSRATFVSHCWFLLAAVGLLILIACANVSNLLMARASARRKETSIRVALGAGRARLVGQLMTESLVIAAVSGGLGVALASVLLTLFELYGPSDLIPAAGVGINGWVVAFAMGVSSVASVLFGLIPALTEVGSGLLMGLGLVGMRLARRWHDVSSTRFDPGAVQPRTGARSRTSAAHGRRAVKASRRCWRGDPP